jgi:Txe/YoeB family toxin of toxin-antitoxin system
MASKDAVKIKEAGLKEKVSQLLSLLEKNPYQTPPSYEKLIGDLEGCCSRRINIKHRLVYKVYENDRYVKIFRMWSHYE